MNSAADSYRIEIHHTTHIDKIPVGELDAAIAEWRSRPWWFRLVRRSPLVRIGSHITIREEPIDGTYDTVESADAAAREQARRLDGVIRSDSTVAVVRVGDTGREVLGGWYAGGRHRL